MWPMHWTTMAFMQPLMCSCPDHLGWVHTQFKTNSYQTSSVCCRSRLSTFSAVMFTLHVLSKHYLLSSSINSAHLLRPARRLLKTIVRNVRQQTAEHGQEAKSYFLSLKNVTRCLDALSLNQTSGFPGQRVSFPPAMAAVRSAWKLWDGHQEEKTFCSTQPLQQCCRAEFSHCESLITYTEVTTCILLTKIYTRSTQNKKLFKWQVFSSRWSLSPSCNPPFYRRKYSQDLMHLFSSFFTFKVMGFCVWKRFAKTAITVPTLQKSGILKSP